MRLSPYLTLIDTVGASAIARRLGIRRQAVAQWDRHPPNLLNRLKLVLYFGLSPAEVLSAEERAVLADYARGSDD